MNYGIQGESHAVGCLYLYIYTVNGEWQNSAKVRRDTRSCYTWLHVYQRRSAAQSLRYYRHGRWLVPNWITVQLYQHDFLQVFFFRCQRAIVKLHKTQRLSTAGTLQYCDDCILLLYSASRRQQSLF